MSASSFVRSSAVVACCAVGAAAIAASAGDGAESAWIEVGRQIFFDTRLSEPAGTSCASCHEPARAFTGDNGSGTAVARGSRPGQLGTRNTPTLMYLATAPAFGWVTKDGRTVPAGGFFWDGRANTLMEQARVPMRMPREMNNPSDRVIVSKVAKADYAPLLRRIAGDQVFADDERAMSAITAALAAFQKSATLAPFSSKFDAVLRGQASFSAQEERGRGLFVIAQKGNCAHCHTMNSDSRDPRDSLFTDFGYHAVGAPRNAAIARPGESDLGLCTSATVKSSPQADDPNRWCGWFKTPTLRNVALTAPYMHNGRFPTLREAVAFYATRDTHPERWYPGEKFDDLPQALRGNVDLDTRPYHRRPGQRPALSDEEVDDIVAFLQTLTDGYTP